MNRQLQVWRSIAVSLQQKIPVMLLYVLESAGSSPGRQGFFMAVNADGDMEGSIGGGIMEHKFVEMAKEQLKQSAVGSRQSAAGSQQSAVGSQQPGEANIRKQYHDKTAATNQSGMICSGEQTILLYPVGEKDATVIDEIIAALEQNRSGTLYLLPEAIGYSEAIPKKDFHFEQLSADDWEYQEKTGYTNQLFIIGGGHCALAFSRLMSTMNFYIRVYDDRHGLKTMQQNEWAHEKIIVDDYSALADLIPEGNDHYVVLMTFGYRSDDKALRSLLYKEFKYLGLLGSKKKIEKMFTDYAMEGIDPLWLQKIHTPVGVSIHSHTPEEIAVSIAAEIIGIKNM